MVRSGAMNIATLEIIFDSRHDELRPEDKVEMHGKPSLFIAAFAEVLVSIGGTMEIRS